MQRKRQVSLLKEQKRTTNIFGNGILFTYNEVTIPKVKKTVLDTKTLYASKPTSMLKVKSFK